MDFKSVKKKKITLCRNLHISLIVEIQNRSDIENQMNTYYTNNKKKNQIFERIAR